MLRALAYGHWGRSRQRPLNAHRTGFPLEGAQVPKGPGRTVGGQCPSDPGATIRPWGYPSSISESIGTHSCGTKHLDLRGHSVLSGLAEGHQVREKLWYMPREDCNEAKGRRTH